MTYDQLPKNMKNPITRVYWDILAKKRGTMAGKRAFDVICSVLLLLLLSPFMLILAAAIKFDSPGPVFYRQMRVGKYGHDFKIYKFRTMVQNAEKIGPPLTTGKDPRITRIGLLIRRLRLDEFSQLLNVLNGSMSLVGPRPEVRRYVEQYSPEYMATLLVRPGITAPASIAFRDEAKILKAGENPEKTYVAKILPPKMAMDLDYIKHISVWNDVRIIFRTVITVF
jgi:lipopolysaccharide/colanic/teichoic acid biosynthesis glycosyltransferase